MDQPGLGAFTEDLFGFLPGDFPTHIVFYNIMSEPAEMETHLGGILTVWKVRIHVFTMLARANRNSEIIVLIQYVEYFFIG